MWGIGRLKCAAQFSARSAGGRGTWGNALREVCWRKEEIVSWGGGRCVKGRGGRMGVGVEAGGGSGEEVERRRWRGRGGEEEMEREEV